MKLKKLIRKTRERLVRNAHKMTLESIRNKEHEIGIMQEQLDAKVADCSGTRQRLNSNTRRSVKTTTVGCRYQLQLPPHRRKFLPQRRNLLFLHRRKCHIQWRKWHYLTLLCQRKPTVEAMAKKRKASLLSASSVSFMVLEYWSQKWLDD